MKWPFILKNEARNEAYEYFDTHIRGLPRNSDGSFNEFDPVYHNTDVDAYRHAYVSGAFTQEYGASVAELFGQLNELTSALSPGLSLGEKNMDLWNNAVGRQYGKKFKNKRELQKAIHDALKHGELIITPSDRRAYEGASHFELNPLNPVVVLDENETGRNETFYDVTKKQVLSRVEFIAMINSGQYPGYSIKQINGVETPVSKPNDGFSDNLG